MPPKTTTDDGKLSNHTRGVPVGRVRPATMEEDLAPETIFRPDAVLSLAGGVPADLPAFEQHVAALVDGVRPVARIRKKSGVSSADLRIALSSLRDRKLVRVTGIVEEAVGELAADIAAHLAEKPEDGNTMSRANPELIPPHVMREIQSMIEEDDAENEFDAPTDVMSAPKDDTDENL
jgi:hypothetical protein